MASKYDTKYFKFHWKIAGFKDIRTDEDMVAHLKEIGQKITHNLNRQLKRAEAKRGQEIESGYTYHITKGGTRARLYIVAATARAQAHEAKHNAILKTVSRLS